MNDLPDEQRETEIITDPEQWREALLRWTELQMKAGKYDVAKNVQTVFETILIRTAMEQ